MHGVCYHTTGQTQGDADPKPPATKTISCGKIVYGNAGWNPACGTPLSCYATNATTGAFEQDPAYATLTYRNGRYGDPVTWCPGDNQPVLTLAAIEQRIRRLLPRVAIGAAWSSTALVNAQTILWADTSTERRLPTVTIVGQRVALRITLDHLDWNFGDGVQDDPTDPGKPYDAAGDPCRTVQCPDYYGHTYRSTGRLTITLAATWHARYRVADGTWTDLDEPITGPTTHHDITLLQARGILVSGPSH